ncbi:hypothetical protein [Novosphingobium kaempferiae]|uniref:hypothetical protein n=1 Tax=Novosphingobium kaempferiae TaxID=2896849 RepID=UPI001E4CF5BF|nr:hypothetical protein [Novosphingobium kaempferiae]
MDTEIQHCGRMIEVEERRAAEAPTSEAAESHHQLAMLYKAQLNLLSRKTYAAPPISA